MAKKSVKKIAAKDADQYMLRLPPGLRNQVARRAAENGRSMNTEIIDAIEKHLRDADRITKLWDLFEKHREDLEAIPHIWGAVEDLEYQVQRLTGDSMGSLTEWRYEKERAARPPITAEQAAELRGLVKEMGRDEAWFVESLRVPSVEAIKDSDFSEAKGLLSQERDRRRYEKERAARPPITAEQAAEIRGLVKERGRDEAWLVESLRVPSIEAIKDLDFSRVKRILSEMIDRRKKNAPT